MKRSWHWSLPLLIFGLPAAALELFYLAVNIAGWRMYTSILSGTVPAGRWLGLTSGDLGLLYALAHLGAFLLAPVLALAALAWAGLERLWRPRD